MNNLLEEIREYTSRYPETLGRAHHWTFSLPLNKETGGLKTLVIGQNPGESETCWELYPNATEESSAFDWHETVGGTPGSNKWKKITDYFAPKGECVLTEFFFWSSHDTGTSFVSRYRGKLTNLVDHLNFCKKINLSEIKSVKPDLILAPGISTSEFFAKLYDLKPINEVSVKINGKNHRLIAHYELEGIPFIFTKHWTGSHAFSNEQRELIRDYIQRSTAKIV